MILAIWRRAHLVLAAVSALFLLLATVSGIILALEPPHQRWFHAPPVALDEVKLGQLITTLKQEYDEVLELSVEKGKYVKISAFSMEEEKSGDFYIDPIDGTRIQVDYEQPAIFKQTRNFHRSLFLKTPGRIFVGIAAFLLLLIAVTGFLLLLNKIGWRRFLFSFEKNDKHQYYHSYLGRINLIPIVIIAGTGLLLSLVRFGWVDTEKTTQLSFPEAMTTTEDIQLEDFDLFKKTVLSTVKKIEFPFSEDAEDYYILYLEDRELTVHQYTGAIVASVTYPFSKAAAILSFKLHTGSTSVIWAMVLLLSSLSILYFMYSGFLISYRRLVTKNKNTISAERAEVIILVGSENGKTRQFGQLVFRALTRQGEKVFIDEMNNFRKFPLMKELIVMTSTYGDGEAPASGNRFLQLVETVEAPSTTSFSVVGFGSVHYEKFCQFAKEVHQRLAVHSAYESSLEPVLVDRNEYQTLKGWGVSWAQKKGIDLKLPDQLKAPKEKHHRYRIIDKWLVDDGFTQSVHLEFRGRKQEQIEPGDLLAIQPAPTEEPRLYSVGKMSNGNLFLAVKKHPHGKVSSQLYELCVGDAFKGAHRESTHFRFPTAVPKVIMIANGTGIGPFVGMLHDQASDVPRELIWGVRNQAGLAALEQVFVAAQSSGQLVKTSYALSREAGAYRYVQDIVTAQGAALAQDLSEGAVIMLCGSLAMQRGVFAALEDVLQDAGEQTLEDYRAAGQVLIDCY